MMSRLVRLQQDFLAMQTLRNGIIRWEDADRRKPPERYVVEYDLTGLIGPSDFHRGHTVVIKLLAEYPDKPPIAKFISRPVLFHPHVFKNGSVCVGRYSAEEGLAAFCLRLAKYIQFRPELIDSKSPANREALAWFKKNRNLVPVDNTRLPDVGEAAPALAVKSIYRK